MGEEEQYSWSHFAHSTLHVFSIISNISDTILSTGFMVNTLIYLLMLAKCQICATIIYLVANLNALCYLLVVAY
jgi:cytochrome c oxidase subunit IV